MQRQKNSQKRLMEELADKALWHRMVMDKVPEPGSIINGLSQKERDVLSTLTADDISDVRWPIFDGINLEQLPRKR